jgi:hypothetical protein
LTARPLIRRLAWFALFWLAGVAALAGVSFAIRFAVR